MQAAVVPAGARLDEEAIDEIGRKELRARGVEHRKVDAHVVEAFVGHGAEFLGLAVGGVALGEPVEGVAPDGGRAARRGLGGGLDGVDAGHCLVPVGVFSICAGRLERADGFAARGALRRGGDSAG